MKKWKAEIWMEDTSPEGEDEYLSRAEIEFAIEKAKAAIEKEWDGLKVADYDVYIDKETEQ